MYNISQANYKKKSGKLQKKVRQMYNISQANYKKKSGKCII